MKKIGVMVILAVAVLSSAMLYSFENENTTLKNKDSEAYEYTIKTAGGEIISDDGALNDNRVEYSTGVRYGRINADSTVSICRQGCELTLTKTGQTITVNPGDSVVIDKGVMQVR